MTLTFRSNYPRFVQYGQNGYLVSFEASPSGKDNADPPTCPENEG